MTIGTGRVAPVFKTFDWQGSPETMRYKETRQNLKLNVF